jgi:hypothetical protein
MNNNTGALPDSWYDLWKLDQPLDFEAFLNSDVLSAKRNEIKTYAIIQRITGSASVIASTCLALHILRSHDGLSTTYHRLVFGLSGADILFSLAHVLSSTMVPKELNYFVPYAQGNTATCDAQGFLVFAGTGVANLYNCSICLYYLSIIRYNKKDDYIRNKLEPWFHGISIIIPFVISFVLLAMKGQNFGTTICFVGPNDPPHCIGYESGDTPNGFSIPCGRGDGGENPILYLVMGISGIGFVLIITPIVIGGTMLLMYRSVTKIERKVQKYGVGSLRASARGDQGLMRRIKRLLMGVIPCLHDNDQPPTIVVNARRRSSTMGASRKRAILYMATGYASAWAFVYLPYIINDFMHESYATGIVRTCLTPLQGLLNFLVFMSPKVRSAKRSRRGENLTWRQAFIKAYMSRGVERRRTGGSTTSRNSNGVSSACKQGLRRFFKVLLTTRDSTSNKFHQSRHPEQDSAAFNEKSPPSNHVADDDLEKCKEQKASSRHPGSKLVEDNTYCTVKPP